MPLDTELPGPAAPSQTQSHGTMLAAVVLGFVLLLGMFYVTTRGVGPFPAEIRRAEVVAGSMTVEVSVRNDGRKGGRANCDIRLVDTDGAVQPKGHRFLTARIEPGQALTEKLTFPVEPGTRATSISC